MCLFFEISFLFVLCLLSEKRHLHTCKHAYIPARETYWPGFSQ
uniref:Uncharacterized protein n=1 Tax=Anguilla anguilla TaxID=7936 RepID=A0A0E9UK83_ANGAN